MDKILNFNEALDVDLLDKIVFCMYQGNPVDMKNAQQVLTQFQQHPDAWTRVSNILQNSKANNTKFFALQILKNTVQFKWNILPAPQRDGIKNFILNEVVTKGKNEQALQQDKVYIQKLNEVLVQIIKQEWPHNWKTFIPEIVNASKTNQNLCENNMNILKMLSEEVFDFSSGKMTQKKIQELKESFTQEFALIFQLCEFILENGKKPALISATLQTLLRFLNWIPVGYIFETKLVEVLVTKFLPVLIFRNDTLGCLTEIAGIADANKYDEKFAQLFFLFLKVLTTVLPTTTNIPLVYKNGSDYDQRFIQLLAVFFSTFFKKHLQVVERDQLKELVLLAHSYLVELSKVDETELFKVCLEYWNHLASGLVVTKVEPQQMQGTLFAPLMLQQNNPRKMVYASILSKVRHVMISKMAKPEEVIIVEDENGQVVKEYMKDVDAIQLYKSMKETLVFLTNLDPADTEHIMLEKLQKQVDGSEWSYTNLNTLCWAIGSISGAMDVRDEKRFLVTVIKDLLGLCEMKKGKPNKAVVASNIMYVVGQYPRFLVQHWKFLKTVVKKLFEFMHEDFPGVQEMACETFLKISKKCKKKFVILHQNETKPFVDELLDELQVIISDLEAQHIHLFYEAVGYMINVADPEHMESLLKKLMDMPNNRWRSIIQTAAGNFEYLKQYATMNDMILLLKTNVAASKSVGAPFLFQMKNIFRDMMELYKAYSQLISMEVQKMGAVVTKHTHVKQMRSIKKETLALVETFIMNSTDVQLISKHFVPTLLEATLGDYKNSVPDARDPGVLSLLTVVISQLQGNILNDLPKIMESVLECTLPMITKNFQDYTEHRINLFNLLRAINKHTFIAFFKIPPQGFKLIIDSILWASKHDHRNIYETGLKILLELLQNLEVNTNAQSLSSFYQSFFLSILNDVLFVLTDTLHTSAFKTVLEILLIMFRAVKESKIAGPLYDPSKMQQPISNIDYIKEHVSRLLCTTFPNLQPMQVQQFILSLFSVTHDMHLFKTQLRDFLVQIKQWSPEETNNLYFEQQKAQKQAQKQLQATVPGLAMPEVRDDIQYE